MLPRRGAYEVGFSGLGSAMQMRLENTYKLELPVERFNL